MGLNDLTFTECTLRAVNYKPQWHHVLFIITSDPLSKVLLSSVELQGFPELKDKVRSMVVFKTSEIIHKTSLPI